jgi:hypothetical protein
MLVRALIRGYQHPAFDVNGDGTVDYRDLKLAIKCAHKWDQPPRSDRTAKPTYTAKPTKTPKPARAPSTPTAPID